MISTPLRSKILSHTRSSSLPSRSHPLIPQFNHHLHQLNSCESTPSSLSSITKKLHFLDHLHDSIDDLLLLPHTRQVFARESREKWAEEILDGYLSLVDACSTAKDLLSRTKEFTLDFLFILRRKRDSEDLLNSRKTTKKMILKCLRNISSFKNKPSVLALDKEEETIATISMLKETESATLEVIESLLVAISGSKGSRGWSLVSKLMNPRKISGQDVEFGEMDAALDKIVGFRTSKPQVDEVLQQRLKEMDVSIGIVEERIERLFKRLIRTRVSLLNMHSL